jgi:hypothetical protein
MNAPTAPAMQTLRAPADTSAHAARGDKRERQPPFRSMLLEGDPSQADLSTPASFSETGVFGREASSLAEQPPAEMAHPHHREEPTAPTTTSHSVNEHDPVATVALDRTSRGLHSNVTNAHNPGTAPQARCGGAPNDAVAAPHSAASARFAAPEEFAPEGANPRHEVSPPSFTSARANAICVAVHAIDNGLAVYARVGRMNATEREQLRQAVRRLLAEHGVSEVNLVIDGETITEAAGTEQWQP